MFSDDGYNNNDQGNFETSSMTTSGMDPAAFSSDVLSDLTGPAQYDYNKGFNDIALLAEFIPTSLNAPEMETDDSVEEFIASSEKIEYTNDGDPMLIADVHDDSNALAAMEDGE